MHSVLDRAYIMGAYSNTRQQLGASILNRLPRGKFSDSFCAYRVLRAFPVRELITEDDTINAEMDPEDVFKVTETIQEHHNLRSGLQACNILACDLALGPSKFLSTQWYCYIVTSWQPDARRFIV